MEREQVALPWLYVVCKRCFEKTPHGVWLVKLRCFQPTQHRREETLVVSIEPSEMRLVEIRYPPRHSVISPVMCCKPRCRQSNHSCQLPHSTLEQDTWKLIIQLRKNRVWEQVKDSRLVSFSKVCSKCYTEAAKFNNTRWLAWLRCGRHPVSEHNQCIVITDKVIAVRELPSSLQDCQPDQISSCSGCSDTHNCPRAHSNEELLYWKWTIVHILLTSKIENYKLLCEQYSCHNDESISSYFKVGLDVKLLDHTYKFKFHKLICLDEVAHALKMASLCNGLLTISSNNSQTGQRESMLRLYGMEGAAMDYAIHGHARAQIPLGNSIFEFIVSHRDQASNCLVLHMPNRDLPAFSGRQVYVHFEINHSYFNDLHKAVNHLNEHALQKLMPSKDVLKRYHDRGQQLSRREKQAVKSFELDYEYQMPALKKLLASHQDVPFLVLGPFGTGKTLKIIAAAVSALLCNRTSRVLVCSHQNTCANNIYQVLYHKLRGDAIIRLVPNENIARYIEVGSNGIVLMKDLEIDDIRANRVIVTTFLTAKNLKHLEMQTGQQISFSHVLIDEGAQAREPETLGALSVVKEKTKIIIVGDHKQSGPKVAVLSELAQEYELGVSLLERLFLLYRSLENPAVIKNHTASLLTNHRCHSSILAFTSSLFYDHTLLSRSSSDAHPLAPFPLLFTCSSIDKNHRNLPEQEQYEAEVLIKAMTSFIGKWPKAKTKPIVGLLASTRRQVEVLKKEWRKCGRFSKCIVEVKPTYLVQGEEFDAVFLSTTEPTDKEGKPHDPVRSMSHELVFNTIMTRAKSLICCVGNPFTLCQIGDQYPINCWKAYLHRCVQCETLQFSLPQGIARNSQIETTAREIQNLVFPHSIIYDAINVPSPTESSADTIIKQYLKLLNSRRENKVGTRLVRKPGGEVDWIDHDEDRDENVVLYRLELSHFDKGKLIPDDPSKPSLKISGRSNLKAIHGDMVKVDKEGKRVLFNRKTELEHYNEAFLCRVSDYNCIIFYPLDKRYQKFANLPTISKMEKRGVVCYDPYSINHSPKVSNVIPHRVALKMVFIVKFLRWNEKCTNPLGIIIGAFLSEQPYFEEVKLRLQYSIPGLAAEDPIENDNIIQQKAVEKRQHFPLAITIDPEGSDDHDDALTCTVKDKVGKKTYTVGVHITDVQCLVRKGSKLDEQAKERGCTVYNAPDSICSPMFPASVLDAASIQPGKKLNSFSVLIDFDVKNEGQRSETISFVNVHILESCVTSEAELTYKEAQDLLQADEIAFTESLKYKIERYSTHGPAFSLQQLVQNLWRFAWFLRKERLKEAAMAYTVREGEELRNPEAHYLVEEFMIHANMQVARRLSRELNNQTILRSQKPPDEKKLDELKKHYRMVLPLSASCKVLNPPNPPTISPLVMLKSQYSTLVDNLRKKKLVDVRHCVQMEHLHPQLLALQSSFRSLQSSAEYCVLKKGDRDGGGHSDLQCSRYTHFTSPLRRYIDIIIQRQLHAVFNRDPNVYSDRELKHICRNVQGLQKNAKDYERDIKSASFTKIVRESQRVYDCVISEIDATKLVFSLSFPDTELRLNPKAKNIIGQQLQRNGSVMRQVEKENKISYRLKVKICSTTLTPANFLNTNNVANEEENEFQFSLYSMDGHGCLTKKRHNVKLPCTTIKIPHMVWQLMHECIMEGTDSLERHRKQIVEGIPLVKDNATTDHTDFSCSKSPLLVYTLSRELKLFDVMKAQLCAAQVKKGLVQEPAIQLLEVGSGLQICVHHNKHPEKCFVGNLLQQASKEKYSSISEYIKCWEPLILSESALTSVKESEFLLIRDAVLEWPDLQLYTNSSGESYYTMTENSDPDRNGVKLSLDKQFMNTSFNFFKMSEGDLVCVRLRSREGDIRYVFHMVINNVNCKEEGEAEVFMKFVLRESNYISPAVHDTIANDNTVYEVQLIPSAISQRRIYRSLKKIVSGTELSQEIALGNPCYNVVSLDMSCVLHQSEITVAKSYWSTSNNTKLNKYQKTAIDIAWKRIFTLIQGPPGTGKSVTGAHIAYALAMRLLKKQEKLLKESVIMGEEQDPIGSCVMYCGPTQQSVNVVMDIFLDLLQYVGRTKLKFNIIRVFSKGVEKIEFPGPEHDGDAFVKIKPSAKCEERHRPFALHHKIRKENSNISTMEKEFDSEGQIPGFDEIRKYRKIISDAEEKILKEGVNIILCTCNEAASHRITNTVEPKYCIIDECAMATEPECMVPIRRAQHVVLIGDHQQLQPVIKLKEAEKLGLGKSLFERYAKNGYPIHVLETQYRMHPGICEFPSKMFYEGKLKTDPSVSQRPGLKLRRFWPGGEDYPIVFCQVEGDEEMGYSGSKRVDPQSKFNKAEVNKIVGIVKKLLHKGVPKDEIAVLTPYSAQRETIYDELNKQSLTKEITVKTITESQGSEFGVVLLSTVRSQKTTDETAEIDSILGFVADPHRICVGITRSKYGLVIVGNEHVLKHYRVWKKLIQHYKDNRCFVMGDKFPR